LGSIVGILPLLAVVVDEDSVQRALAFEKRSALEQLLAADRQEFAHGTVRLVGQVRSLAERRIAERSTASAHA
jgi:hypothetical protein